MKKLNGFYLTIIVSVIVAGAAIVALAVVKKTQKPPELRSGSSLVSIPNPTEPQATPATHPPLAYLEINQADPDYLSFYLLPTKKISPNAITLKLKLAPDLTLAQAQALSNRLKLNSWWQEQGFKLQLNRLNPKDKTLELALIQLGPKNTLLLPDQAKPFFTLKTKMTPDQVKIVPSQSVIMLKDAADGVIRLKP